MMTWLFLVAAVLPGLVILALEASATKIQPVMVEETISDEDWITVQGRIDRMHLDYIERGTTEWDRDYR